MSFAQRFALVLMAAFFVASLATSLAAAVFAPAIVRAIRGAGAAGRAWTLAAYRLLPAILAITITATVLGPAYFRHEQRVELEGVGLALALCAAGGLLLIAISLARVATAVITTASLRRGWLATGRPLGIAGAGMPAYAIDVPFPLVAVLGVLRPRLFISTCVLRGCSGAELDAIIAHERRHVSAFDNAVRLLMDAAPDALGFTRASASLASAWHHAAEHRADDAAARRLDLASALVRVARLAGGARAGVLPASSLYRGEAIEERVKRLIGTPPDAANRGVTRGLAAAAAALAMLIVAAALSPRASEIAHGILEAAVSLP